MPSHDATDRGFLDSLHFESVRLRSAIKSIRVVISPWGPRLLSFLIRSVVSGHFLSSKKDAFGTLARFLQIETRDRGSHL